jgi:hypothetical protein
VASSFKQFETTVLRACQRPLEDIGWKKRNIAVYILDLSPRRFGRLGFNTGGDRANLDLRINPLVGVTDLLVKKIATDLVGLPPQDPRDVFTIFTPLGYLMPQQKYLEWKFSPEQPIGEGVRAMTEAIARYGIPFMRSHDDLDKIIEKMTLRQPWGWPNVLDFTRPIALALAGRREEAEQAIARKLKELSGAQYPAAEQFRTFAARFAEWKPDVAHT